MGLSQLLTEILGYHVGLLRWEQTPFALAEHAQSRTVGQPIDCCFLIPSAAFTLHAHSQEVVGKSATWSLNHVETLSCN